MTDDPSGRDAIRRYAILTAEKRRLEAEAKANAAHLEAVTPLVLQHFEATGELSVKIAADPEAGIPSNMTVHLRTEHWPSKTAEAELATPLEIQKAFVAAGLAEYCEPRVNTQGLRAWLAEALKQARERAKAERRNAIDIEPEHVIPDALRPYIGVKTVHKVGAVKA